MTRPTNPPIFQQPIYQPTNQVTNQLTNIPANLPINWRNQLTNQSTYKLNGPKNQHCGLVYHLQTGRSDLIYCLLYSLSSLDLFYLKYLKHHPLQVLVYVWTTCTSWDFKSSPLSVKWKSPGGIILAFWMADTEKAKSGLKEWEKSWETLCMCHPPGQKENKL